MPAVARRSATFKTPSLYLTAITVVPCVSKVVSEAAACGAELGVLGSETRQKIAGRKIIHLRLTAENGEGAEKVFSFLCVLRVSAVKIIRPNVGGSVWPGRDQRASCGRSWRVSGRLTSVLDGPPPSSPPGFCIGCEGSGRRNPSSSA